MNITGQILKIGDLEVFSNGKRKQSIVVGTNENPRQEFEIHFYDNDIDKIEKIYTSDLVKIKFTLRSEIFEDDSGKSYFTHMIGMDLLDYKRWR